MFALVWKILTGALGRRPAYDGPEATPPTKDQIEGRVPVETPKS